MKRVDVLIEKGKIAQISKSISKKGIKTLESPNLHVSPGWIDIGAMCWDPGHEYREDKHSLRAAAVNGGYTRVLTWPNTDPVIDNKAQYQYYTIENGAGVQLLPISSITKKAEGKVMTEMYDLNHMGARIFSDGLLFTGHSKELYKALEYTKALNTSLLLCPDPFLVNPDGQIHESKYSIVMGLPGLSEISEVMSIQQIISLGEYADSTFILHNISSKEGLKLSKSKCIKAIGVSYLNMCKDVSDCDQFNTNNKVIPPLRSKTDKKALLKGVESGQIGYISSNHYPLENDLKDKEFGLAEFGSSGIETVFSALHTHSGLDIEKIIEALSYGPADAADLEIHTINEGSIAECTMFDPSVEWTYDHTNRKSKSANNPYLGEAFKGKVLGVITS